MIRLIKRKKKKPKRPIRFFCTECGKEMWKFMKYEDHDDDTLEELLAQLQCSNCMKKIIREDVTI